MHEELTTGRITDPRRHLRGDTAAWSGLERDLRLVSAQAESRNEAASFASAQQTVLEEIRTVVTEAGTELLGAQSDSSGFALSAMINKAGNQFPMVVNALNSSFGGRSLFSGAATQGAALADSATMMADLTVATTGATTAADVLLAVDTWFYTASGGFETSGYLGSTDVLAPVTIADNEAVTFDVSAEDAALRHTVRNFAVAALMQDGLLSGNLTEAAALATEIGQDLMGTAVGVVDLQAKVGNVEARIETAEARGSARKTALTLALDKLVGADAYETVTEIQNAEAQLQTIYTLTARLSGMSLASVLR
ncbi:MAG: flagellin [Qingshengfaniella sp.]